MSVGLVYQSSPPPRRLLCKSRRVHERPPRRYRCRQTRQRRSYPRCGSAAPPLAPLRSYRFHPTAPLERLSLRSLDPSPLSLLPLVRLAPDSQCSLIRGPVRSVTMFAAVLSAILDVPCSAC